MLVPSDGKFDLDTRVEVCFHNLNELSLAQFVAVKPSHAIASLSNQRRLLIHPIFDHTYLYMKQI